jgi:hypothetical protein
LHQRRVVVVVAVAAMVARKPAAQATDEPKTT